MESLIVFKVSLLFCVLCGVGLSLFQFTLLPIALVGRGLYRVMSGVSLMFFVLGVGCFFPITRSHVGLGAQDELIYIILGCLSFLSVVLVMLRDDRRPWWEYGVNILLVVLGVLLLWFLSGTESVAGSGSGSGIGTGSGTELKSFIYLLAKMLWLGIISYAMLLGHWYLVVPKLSESVLLKASLLIFPLGLIQFLIFIFSYLGIASWMNDYSNITDAFPLKETVFSSERTFLWVMLLMRFGWGLVAVLILNYFNVRLVKLRSIQSATGVLYVMLFFVLGGELIALYLFKNYFLGV